MSKIFRWGSKASVITAIISSAVFASANAQENCGAPVNFEQAEIATVIDEFALRTGRKFVLSPNVNGRVTIKSGPDAGLCADEAWELFQAALRVSGFTATPINGTSYAIVPIQQASRSPGAVGEIVNGEFVTQIIRLQHIDAREASASLTQIVSERAVVSPVRSSNAIIVVDYAENISRITEVVKSLDKDTAIYRTVTLQNISSVEAVRVVEDIAKEITEENATQGGKISALPMEASNSVLIRAEPVTLKRVVSVLRELDKVGEAKTDLSVIRLRHANAEEIVELLRDVADARPRIEAEGGAQPSSKITFHAATNSVIISGDASLQQSMRNIISQLDIRRAQVLVEAIIVEVSDDTARELGLQYFLSGDGSENGRVPFTTTNFSTAQPNIIAAAGEFLLGGDDFTDDTTRDLALSSLGAISGFALGGAGRLNDGTVFGAILTALQQDNESRVLSLPSVLTLDNQEAELSNGQEIPITTGEAVGDNFSGGAFRTVSREEVGIILRVTPRITDGDVVTLEIYQETSSVAGQILLTSSDLITNKSTIQTAALVDNGDILVLGGLIDQTEEYTDNKVPLLGDIPIAGNLFKSQGKSKSQRNLMIFIRPTIIRSREDAGGVTSKKLDYIRARDLLASDTPVSEIDRLIDQATGSLEDY